MLRSATTRWLDKSRTNGARAEALNSLRLAVARLSDCEETRSASDWADALSDADAHIDQARQYIEDAFRGIYS